MKYDMNLNEVETLLLGLVQNGKDKMYQLMRDKAFGLIQKEDDIDIMFMDMYEYMLSLARENLDDNMEVEKMYYTLSSILRKLAQESHLFYIQNNKASEDNRFLRTIKYIKNSNIKEP